MSNFQKTVRIMENPTLPTNWLAALSNARSASRWVTLVQQEPRRHSNHLDFRNRQWNWKILYQIFERFWCLPPIAVGFQESGQETGATGTDCSNLHFHCPRRSPFFWNPAPLEQNYMIKSVKMTKKSISRDQFSWKVRTFAQNLCENGLHLGKERALCTRFAPSLQRK